MEDTKQSENNLPQPLTPEQATTISGGDGSCAATATVGTGGVTVTNNGPTPSDVLIGIYEGFVDVTSHIIERVTSVAR